MCRAWPMLSAKIVAQKPVGSVRPPLSPVQLDAVEFAAGAELRLVSRAAPFLSELQAARAARPKSAIRCAFMWSGCRGGGECGDTNMARSATCCRTACSGHFAGHQIARPPLSLLLCDT